LHFKKRIFIYLILLAGIFSLQVTGFFAPVRTQRSLFRHSPKATVLEDEAAASDDLFLAAVKSETCQAEVKAEEVESEPFTGKGGPQEPELELSFSPYEVQPGDNLWEIAKRENLDLDTLISANKLKRANLINAGDILHIPNQKGIFHKVRKGETLSEIAKIYKVTIEEVLEINEIEDPQALTINAQLFIPGAKLLPEEREYILGWGFIRPCRGWISSRYGWRRDPFTGQRRFHHGIDLAAPRGTPVYAARDGRVIRSGWTGGYGRIIIIKHSRGYSTRYGHNSVNLVKNGQYVRQGQLIARVGNSGRSTGSHLHFEVRRWGRPLNPLPLIRSYARRK